ncbi:MAG: fructosamine kinase family protein [Treponema sp.]|nr:fructosamine kinase family protein [Treponema sp.]
MAQTVPQFTSLAHALASLFGNAVSVVHAEKLSGGDINKAYGLTLSNGTCIFMKANAKENAAFFTAEAAGLFAIASTRTINVPRVLCCGTDPGEQAGYSFLLLEYIAPRKKNASYWETFGHELALLHKAECASFSCGKLFGFTENNFIGATAQINNPHNSWIDFFRECRLVPQFQKASQYFDNALQRKITKLLDKLDEFIVEPASPSLVHGDLWSGNVMCGGDGKAHLIDPACYCGNREIDIAMTELFGSFPSAFYDAYNESYKLESGYEMRRDMYNLYQLLNHLNLFGRTYFCPVCDIINEYVGGAT